MSQTKNLFYVSKDKYVKVKFKLLFMRVFAAGIYLVYRRACSQ